MKIVSIFILILLLFAGCFSGSTKIGSIDDNLPSLEILLSFNSESYPWLMGKKYPQMAIWIKDKNSSLTRTVFITEKGGKNKWFGADNRPSAFPVWYGILEKEKDAIKIDSVTGATPSGETARIGWQIPAEFQNKDAEVFIEANVSFDYNEFYPENAAENAENFSDVNGQPSLIWKCELKTAGKSQKVKPEIIGHGHVLGKDNKIYPDMKTITSAKSLFNYIEVQYNSGAVKAD